MTIQEFDRLAAMLSRSLWVRRFYWLGYPSKPQRFGLMLADWEPVNGVRTKLNIVDGGSQLRKEMKALMSWDSELQMWVADRE